MRKIGWIVFTLVVCFMLTALVAAQDEAKVKGLITGRTADRLTLQMADGSSQAVILTDDTQVRSPKGLGMRHEQHAWTTLLPGLAVTVKGSTNAKGDLVASQIEFSKESLRMASTIQAGLQPTKEDVAVAQRDIAQNREGIATNKQAIQMNAATIEKNARETNARFDSLADYEQKGQMTIYFKPGSSTISAQDKAILAEKAAKVLPLRGYLIEIKGFADSTGRAAMNQSLSKARAEAVIAYLMQQCKIPARHLLAPGAMGVSNPVASNETATGRQNNRRVEIVLMVNKAIEPPTSAKE